MYLIKYSQCKHMSNGFFKRKQNACDLLPIHLNSVNVSIRLELSALAVARYIFELTVHANM